MALITFLSDFGETDHYVASVKAKILAFNPNLRIVDISHGIEACNLAHASYVLESVFRDFPEGSIHLVAVASTSGPEDRFVGLQIDSHYFLGNDNGIWGLLGEGEASQVVEIPSHLNTSFPAKDILAPVAAKLASGASLSDVGSPVTAYKRMLPRTSRASKKQIHGQVVHVDHYGNLVTNILQKDFEVLSQGKGYTIKFGRESIHHVQNSYNSVDHGDVFLLFNSRGLLEIGISHGNAANLLGLHYDSPVIVQFEE